jgi:L-ascorbate metabolism protein UlaG (beta-lactamase superfamily)
MGASCVVTRALLALVFAVGLFAFPHAMAQAPATGQGKVKVEWLGHEFFRLTSPNGVVVLTSPWLDNPDGPVKLDDLKRTDIILVPNAHNDDMGNPAEIAAASGATVIVPAPLGRWLIAEKGLKQEQFKRAGVGDIVTVKGITIKIGPNAHDNTMPNGVDGGPAASFFITFENGFTVFYPGHATLLADLPLYAALYQPNLALLGLVGDPREFAAAAKLLSTNNPKLKTVIPDHMRPNAPIVADGKRALEKVGLGSTWFLPELRKPYEY